MLPQFSEKGLALIACVAGVVLAILADAERFQDFLYLIGSVFAPMTAILLTDYFLLKEDHGASAVNWLNLVLWAGGFFLYRFFLDVETPLGITFPVVIIIMVISAACHKALRR